MTCCDWRAVASVAIVVLIIGASLPAHSETHAIDSAKQLREIRDKVVAGDEIVLRDGIYTDQHFVFSGTGTEEQPITLRAETPERVILNGTSRLSIGGDHLVVDGLFFNGGALESGSVIEFQSDEGTPARHCLLRNTAIKDYNPPEKQTRYFWVSLFGYANRVENCTFSGQKHSGVTLCVRLTNGESAGHRIHRNYFFDRPEGTGNGFETIRIGTGSERMTKARCVVSENVFERCSGEMEIISNKSCENTYSGNTFLQSAGTLTLRQGDRCVIENNVFKGGDAVGTGGLRVTGDGHRIAGNYFSGTKGRGGGAISLRAGIAGTTRGGYSQVTHCSIDGNTFINNPGTLFALDAGYQPDQGLALPAKVMFSNNLVVVKEGEKEMISATTPSTGITWKENLLVSAVSGQTAPEGFALLGQVPPHMLGRLEPAYLKGPEVGAAWAYPLLVKGMH